MDPLFSDFTTTGHWAKNLRGFSRATVVARAEDRECFEWLVGFKREFLDEGEEAKSKNVLPILDNKPSAKKFVLRNIESYSIFIADLHEYRQLVLDNIIHKLHGIIPPGMNPYKFVLEIPQFGSAASDFIRQMAINDSVVGQIESFLSWAKYPYNKFDREDIGNIILHSSEVDLLDNNRLMILLSSLGSAIGDILAPDHLADTIIGNLNSQQFLTAGYLAQKVVIAVIEKDNIYDIGPAPILDNIRAAQERIYQYVDTNISSHIDDKIKPGIIEEKKSHTQLGLQAADIAAAIACREYELSDAGENRGMAVKRIFNRVLLNGTWI